MKQFITKYYILALPVSIVFAGLWLYYSPVGREDVTLAITMVGGIISFFYVVQKQQLEELQTFKELFNDFNNRYDKMNEKLNKMHGKPIDIALTENERDILNDYFNLCSEEYLYYRKGYIYREVWISWCKGMLHFLEDERIKNKWFEEEKTNSYYGLTLEIIRKETK